MSTAVERSQVSVGPHRIAVLRSGTEGETVVLVHGFGADRQSFAYLQPLLARNARTVAFDLPGHGDSSPLPPDGGLSAICEALVGVVESTDGDAVHIVAHSLGAAATLSVLDRLGDRLGKLTLIAPAGIGETVNATFVFDFLAMSDVASATVALRHLVARRELVGPAMAAAVLRAVQPEDRRAGLGRLAREIFDGPAQRLDLRQALARSSLPVQVIWGEDDAVLPVTQARDLPIGIPIHRLAGVGHMPHMEAPKAVAEKIAGCTETWTGWTI